MKSDSGKPDKRRSVRTTSRILFAHQKVAAQQFGNIREDCDNGISLYNRADLTGMHIYRGARGVLSRLHEKDKDLAAFLQHLDAKLNLLIKGMNSTPTLYDSMTLQPVNLGGNGVAFWTSKDYAVGDFVEMHFIVPPDEFYINCFSEVVDSQQENSASTDKPVYRIASKFMLIMEPDREVLVQHNFKQQGLALQRRRLNSDGEV